MSGIWDNGENQLPSGLFTPVERRFPWRWVGVVCFFGFSFIALAYFSVHYSYIARTLQLGDVPPSPVGIILGASINADNTPSDALMDRLKTGASLYRYGLVRDLLVTGDDGAFHSNEVAVMKNTLISLNVPENHIYIDPHGYRTYESCKRAIQTFHVTQAIIVTQRFHLPRALFLCNELGIESFGVPADLQKYKKQKSFEFREFFATIKAFIDMYILEPKSPVKVEG